MKKRHRRVPEWKVEPVSSDRFQKLAELPMHELAAMLVSAYGRIRDLEMQVAALRG